MTLNLILSLRYDFCACCCRGKPDSVCKAHKTGYRYALQIVDDAVRHGSYLDVDISYSNLKICPTELSRMGSYTVRKCYYTSVHVIFCYCR